LQFTPHYEVVADLVGFDPRALSEEAVTTLFVNHKIYAAENKRLKLELESVHERFQTQVLDNR
jgi:hypothetical protein